MKGLLAGGAVLGCWGVLAAASLTWERTIPLPGVEGRIDHFAHDAAGHRLFVAALGNDTVEVIDLKAGRVVHSITGLAEPQGIAFVSELNRIYIANGGDGTVRVFEGSTFAPVATVKFDDDADNVRYDAVARWLYVGHGGGAIGAIDVTTNKIVAEMPLTAHPESFQLEHQGPRLFVNVPDARHVAVVDREKKTVVDLWPLRSAAANFPMALDEENHRLLIGGRRSARLIVLDANSGKEVAQLGLHGDCDDLFFDRARRRIYASCGEGFVDVFTEIDADHYERTETQPTEPRARTCFVDGARLYLAVPKRGDQSAAVRCYRLGE